MVEFRTLKKNGKRRVVPIRTASKVNRQITPREIEDLTGVGIRHPGSLTGLGYHINEPESRKREALRKAVEKYGKKETLRKLGELYRLDFNRPALKEKIAEDIRFVSGVNA